MTELFQRCEELQDELAQLNENHPHLAEFSSIQDAYFALAASVEDIIHVGAANDNANRERPQDASSVQEVKLPRAELPRFDGQYDKWMGFKNEF